MRIVSPEEMRILELNAVNLSRIPSIALMEHAAAGAYRIIRENTSEKSKGLILAGGGNNGGDAMAVARMLHGAGREIDVFVLCDKSHVKGDALINYRIISGIMPIDIFSEPEYLNEADINEYDYIVDGIFGIGLNRKISEGLITFFEKISETGVKTFALDIPSGICGSTGRVMGGAINADITITMGYPKIGLYLNDGPDYSGKIYCVEIGLPRPETVNFLLDSIDDELFREIILPRKHNSNKGTYGKILCIGGCNEMRGAPLFAAQGAFAAGAGLVYCAVTQRVWDGISAVLPDAIGVIMKENERGCISSENIDKLLLTAESMDAIVIGPGMGNSEETADIVRTLAEETDIPMIIDADGLNSVCCSSTLFEPRKLNNENVITTPHPGECARLTGVSTEDVLADPEAAAKKVAEMFGGIVVLKGTGTIITDGVTTFINTSGTPGLAVAGTGDVLSGILGAFSCKNSRELIERIACGVYLHGRAAETAINKVGEDALTAGDLSSYIGLCQKEIMGG